MLKNNSTEIEQKQKMFQSSSRMCCLYRSQENAYTENYVK